MLTQHSRSVSALLHVSQEPELEEEKAQNFSILQPGSSVATALSEGESKRKHIMVLEVMGEQWRTIKVALKTVRPFVFESVSRHARAPVYQPTEALQMLCTAAFTYASERCVMASAKSSVSAIQCCGERSFCKHASHHIGAAPGLSQSCLSGHESTCIVQIALAKQKGLNPDEPEV